MMRWYLVPLLLIGIGGCSSGGDTTPSNDLVEFSDTENETSAPDTETETETLDTEEGDTELGDSHTEDTDIHPPPPKPEWTEIPLGAAGDLHKIHFLDDLGFIIVGQNGTVLRPLGDGWVRQWTPHASATLRDVTRHRGQLHAVGDSGTWLVQNSLGAWLPFENTIKVNLNGVASLPDGLVAVGQDGNVIRKHAQGIKYEQVNPDYHLNAIASAGNGEAFVAATNGLVLRRGLEPGECVPMSNDICAPCAEDSDCGDNLCLTFLGGKEMQCSRPCTDGSECPNSMDCVHLGDTPHCQPAPVVDWFATEVGPADTAFHDVIVLDPFNVWVVGDNSHIARYSGPWSKENCKESKDLHAVGGGAGRLYSVGESGTFVQRNADGDWPKAADLEGPLLLEKRYQGVAVGGERVVAVGTDGALQVKVLPEGPFLDGSAQPAGAIRDIAVRGENAVLVGDHGWIVWMDSQGYGALKSGTDATLNGAHITNNQVMWAAGHGGTLLRRPKDNAISLIQAPTQANLHSLVSLAGNQLIAVGQAGTILHIEGDGDELLVENSGQAHDLLDLFMDGDILTAVGKNGTILRRINSQWSPLAVNLSVDLHAGHSNGDTALVVGAQGTIVSWSSGSDAVTKIVDPSAIYFDVVVAQDGSATLAGWAGKVQHRATDGVITDLNSPTQNTIYAANTYNDALLLGGTSSSLWHHTGGR